MELEYLDLVDTISRLREICKKLDISDILEGNAKQIEIISEIKSRVENMEVERVEAVDLGMPHYKA
jgi:hypothetical protein|tara:strand:- start:269 stop:466 length:198 start_codon:yes stop_codon:yes gene_type:complete